ncbi:hypothetical protein [Kitasatospora indigofera]|uniref:hypothetical protein n=1 Tax=Kitasatospora indigofera TaxID=67307 RepID=UPI0033A7D2CC
MSDQSSLALVSLISTGVFILASLAGAVVAATFIRRRGLNASLAMAGCLVTALGPVALALTLGFGGEVLSDSYGAAAMIGAQSAISGLFSLTGLGLVLAGALAAPPRPVPPSAAGATGQAGAHPVAGAAATL